MSKWRVSWVPKPVPNTPPCVPVQAGWTDLAEREASAGIRPGDPILLAPDYRIDELLSLYTRSSPFRGYTKETKRNYITDLCLFLNFLRRGGLRVERDTGTQDWKVLGIAGPSSLD